MMSDLRGSFVPLVKQIYFGVFEKLGLTTRFEMTL